MKTNDSLEHSIVSREQWLEARRELLAREKAFTRECARIARARRELPWVKVEKSYQFSESGENLNFEKLFGDKSQLVVYHFMFGPDWEQGCPSCSFWADNYNGISRHLAERDTALVAVSRVQWEKLAAYRKRMGWDFRWVSSLNSDFNFDFQVSFSAEDIEAGNQVYNYQAGRFGLQEGPGISVFYRDRQGQIFHTYSCYARGLDDFNACYRYLDIVPRGRDEDALEYPMAWVRRHDEY